MSHPPRITTAILRLVLPRGIRGEAVLGDLEEEFHDRCDQIDEPRAAWWYRRQAWRLAAGYASPWARPTTRDRALSPADAASRSNVAESLAQDLRHGARQLARNPGVSILVVAALALGIGANTAIFSAIDAVLLTPLPFEDPDRIVQLMERRPSFPDAAEVEIPIPNFADYEEAASLSRLAAIRPTQVYVHEGERRPERVAVHFSSALLDMMGVRPALGRGFLAADDRPGGAPVVLLSHAYWRSELGGDSTVLGDPLTITHFVQGEGFLPLTLEIVGVMPEGFLPPPVQVRNEFRRWGEGELFLPMGVWSWGRGNRGQYALRAVAELAPGISVSAAGAEVSAIASAIAENDPVNSEGLSAHVAPLNEIRRHRNGTVLAVLWAASALILLVVCANVASLLMGRGLAREREMAVRTSLGASRGRLLRQLLVESAVLGVTGATVGLFVARWGAALLKRLTPGEVTGLADAGLDLRVLVFAAGASLATILLFGLGPAVRGTRTHPAEALRSGGRGAPGGGLGPMRWLVVGQVALSLSLLVGSGLLVRSLEGLLGVDPGFDTETTIRITLTPPPPFVRTMQNADRAAFYESARYRLEGIPGVRRVGAARIALLSGSPSGGAQITPADRMASGAPTEVEWIGTLPGFPEAVGTPLVRGRALDEADLRRALEGDRAGDPWEGIPVMVNQSLADSYWPGADPLGKRFYWGVQDPAAVEAFLGTWTSGDPWPEGWDNRYPPPRPLEVVGVVADMLSIDLKAAAPPTFYSTNPFAAFTLYVRVDGDPDVMTGRLRSAVDAVDPDIQVASAQTMSTAVRQATADTRFQAMLLTLFAGLAVLMTGLGLFGVLAHAASRRTHEIAVRISLGAKRGEVSGMIVRDGLALGLPGIVLGLALALLGTRFLSSLLFGVSPEDPLTLVGSTVLVLVVVLAASWWPAARATRVQPMEVLREE